MRRLRLFISLGGQDDNIGDSILRRRLLEATRIDGVEHHIFTGRQGAGYIAGLGVQDHDKLYRSYAEWRVALIANAIRGSAWHVHNAGEIQVNRSRMRNSVVELVVNLLGRLWRHPSVFAGVGLRDPTLRLPWIIRAAIGQSALALWRDEPSQQCARLGEHGPDWAFGIAGNGRSSPPEPRSVLVISMRGDRPPLSREWIEALRAACIRHDLIPVVVTQVSRDSERNAQIAAELACEHMSWQSDDHAVQERAVRQVHARARAVVSDRLHALIVGISEGAAPAGVVTQIDRKLDRTLSAAGFHGRVLELDEYDRPDRLDALIGSDDVETRAEDAFQRVAALDARVRRVASTGRDRR